MIVVSFFSRIKRPRDHKEDKTSHLWWNCELETLKKKVSGLYSFCKLTESWYCYPKSLTKYNSKESQENSVKASTRCLTAKF